MYFEIIEGTKDYVDVRTGEVLSKNRVNYLRKLNKPITDEELAITELGKCLTEEDLKAYGRFWGIKPANIAYTHCFAENRLAGNSLNLLLKLYANDTYSGHGYFSKQGVKNFQRYLQPLVDQGYVSIIAETKQGIRYVLTQDSKGAVCMGRKDDNTTAKVSIYELTANANEFVINNDTLPIDAPTEIDMDDRVYVYDGKSHRGIAAPYVEKRD